MEFNYILGVDMSKEWFHFCLKDPQFSIIYEGQVDNHPDAIFEFISQLSQVLADQKSCIGDVLLVMEHTGIYVQHLSRCWLSKSGRLSMVDGHKINLSLDGMQKRDEKTDPLDARRIAEYGIRFTDKLRLWQASPEAIQLLKHLQRQRERLIKALNLLKVPVAESRQFDSAKISKCLCHNQKASVEALKNDIKAIEKQLEQIIDQDDQLKKFFKLMTSISGIGPAIAREVLIATQGFTRFKPHQAKAFSKYNGVIPLTNESGKSVRKRQRTSKQANKHIKKLLTMGALSIIHSDSELAQYYDRKIREGKHHNCVINAIRNKLLLRIFAVVRNDTMYQKNLNYSLAKP